MNLHQKMVEIKKCLESFKKDTKGFNYKYVSGSQVLGDIKEKMDELGVLLIPELDYNTLHWEKHEYTNSKNQDKLDFIITAKMTYTWINAEDPDDKIVVPWVCIGQQADDIAKAVGTAMTYNERYFLLKFLGVPTDEDDADHKEPANAVKSKKNTKGELTESQINRLYAKAYAKGIEREKVKSHALKKFNKDIEKLSKEQYETMCEGYDNM
ncbi:ERF family protein [Clostridioides mangenotii]|uniref:ERF family protein n=1 Tax=Metaclostridioides mangenotii TaxID=1540 RepID=UPI00214A613F|nr:ERF family protein [Clostridioides mangenotii]MCR1955497.1 ERF family protein [Clostridioides mangenotii]